LTKFGVTYDNSFDYTPSVINIEKEDPRFFSAWGRPRLASTKPFMQPHFENESACYFVDLEVFTPQLARDTARLAGTSSLK
jgi:hypothetical protein